jgi:hypothetical protein
MQKFVPSMKRTLTYSVPSVTLWVMKSRTFYPACRSCGVSRSNNKDERGRREAGPAQVGGKVLKGSHGGTAPRYRFGETLPCTRNFRHLTYWLDFSGPIRSSSFSQNKNQSRFRS